MAIIQGKPNGASTQSKNPPPEDAIEYKLPSSVNFIVGNEFCERFSYYGMRTVLALYLVDHLHQSEEQATEFLHLFIVACYMTPLLGAFISDSYIGKYRTILYLSVVYCLGNWAMAASALPSQAPNSIPLTFLGLGLIAMGTGGIKPCVSAFGGDQIELSYPPSSARNTLLRRFFSAFYFSINAGAVLSTLITPLIRSYVNYAWAFAIPAWLMMLSLALFYLGSGGYKHQPPGGNVVAHVAGVIWTALTWRGDKNYVSLPEAEPPTERPQKAPRRPPPQVLPSKPIGISARARFSNFIGGNSLRTASIFMRGTPPENKTEQQQNLLSGAEISGSEAAPSVREGGSHYPVPRPPSRRNLSEIGAQAVPPAGPPAAAIQRMPPVAAPTGQVAKPHWLDAAKAVHGNQDVEDVKVLLRVLLLFVPAPLFWSLFDQQSSRWVFQARRLDGRLPFGLVIEPDQMQVLNSMFILIMIPLFDRGIYPFLERRGVSLRPIRRMVVGMFIAAVAFVISAALQIAIDHGNPQPAEGLTSAFGAHVASGLRSGGAEIGRRGGRGDEEYERLSMLWQVPQYIVLTAGEILFSITGLELAYSQAPTNMTSVVSSAWLLSVAAGNLVTVAVVGIIGDRLTLANEFFFFAAGCIVAMLALRWVGRGFAYVVARQPRKQSSAPAASTNAPSQDVEQGLQ